MMAWRNNRIKYSALGVLVLWLIVFAFLRNSQSAMRWLAHSITTPYKQAVGAICNAVSFSVAELVWVAFVLGSAAYIVVSAVRIVRAKGQRAACVWRQAVGALILALAVYSGFTLLWGVNYYTGSVTQQMGVSTRNVSVTALTRVTQLFANHLNDTADDVPRNESGLFDVSPDIIFADGADIYTALEQEYPFLEGPHIQPKPMAFSWLMSEINYTGFFFPFTGEANLNANQPACLLPATIAHELAHVRAVAPEQDCNFLAVRACETSGNVVYAYSGWLLGYIHLSNALYTVDYEAWKTVSTSLSDVVHADLADNSTYWARYDTPAATAANQVYDSFLKSYSQTDGVKSYGRVVDLLVAWYGQDAV